LGRCSEHAIAIGIGGEQNLLDKELRCSTYIVSRSIHHDGGGAFYFGIASRNAH
jgi:hypothetical protein